MSNRLIRLARQVESCSGRPIRATEKAVLVALADDARDCDAGRSSLATYQVMARTSLSERAVRYAYKTLAAAGHITREAGVHGFVGATIVHPRSVVAPVHDVHPPGASGAPPGCTTCTPPIETSDSTILPVTSAGAREADEADQVFDEWDRVAAKHQLPGAPIERDAARRAAIEGHLKTRKLYLLLAAIGQVDRARGRMSKVTPGQGDFLASFDWVFDVGSRSGMRTLTKLLEGEFNLGRAVPPDRPASIPDPMAAAEQIDVSDDPPELARVRDELLGEVGVPSFETWLRPLGFVALAGDTLRLAAPSHFVADWVTSNFLKAIAARASAAWGRPLRVELIVVRQLARAGSPP